MSVADVVAPHVPSLRRFSRAVHGSRSAGDERVADCLRSILDEPGRYDLSEALLSLFRLFLSFDGPAGAVDGARSHMHDRALGAMSTNARNAFLLTSLERFSIPQTASILNVGIGDVETFLTEAGQQIAKQIGTTVLIIEDEPILAMDIEALVESFGHEVVGVARTRREAVILARKTGPGLILADVQLADGSSGIDAVAELQALSRIPTIFVTAFPQRLLTGAVHEPTYLITKPYEPEELRAMLSVVLFFRDADWSDEAYADRHRETGK
ncbi:CheY-like chemotaxis protein [Amorphus suaedae]